MNTSLKVFGKWDLSEVQVGDPGLKNYIGLTPVLVPSSGGRHAKKQFGKSNISIVERLINKVMVTGHEGKAHRRTSGRNTGKKQKASKIVRGAFETINKKTKKNPAQILANAVSNASPREETTRIRYGGIVYHQAVDVAPQRRLDMALRLITLGAAKAAFKSKKSIEQCLADEIMSASKYDTRCYSIAKKEEIERISKAAR
ncbi:MAG: 30S ribosomal protein S7 [Candidatus Hydrothermarchaeales archaeon]